MDALPTKDSGRALVREVEAVEPGIALALDDPIATNLEAEDSLALNAPIATNLQAEDGFLANKPRSDNLPLGFLGNMTTSNHSAAI